MPSNALVSLVSLMGSYLVGGLRSGPYAKSLVPMLAKTDFAEMFSQLPADERQYFTDDPGRWLNFVLSSVDMATRGAEPFFAGDIEYAKGHMSALPRHHEAWLDPTDRRSRRGHPEQIRGSHVPA